MVKTRKQTSCVNQGSVIWDLCLNFISNVLTILPPIEVRAALFIIYINAKLCHMQNLLNSTANGKTTQVWAISHWQNFDVDFQYPTSYGHDPLTSKTLRLEVSWFKKQSRNKQTDTTDCSTLPTYAVGSDDKLYPVDH